MSSSLCNVSDLPCTCWSKGHHHPLQSVWKRAAGSQRPWKAGCVDGYGLVSLLPTLILKADGVEFSITNYLAYSDRWVLKKGVVSICSVSTFSWSATIVDLSKLNLDTFSLVKMSKCYHLDFRQTTISLRYSLNQMKSMLTELRHSNPAPSITCLKLERVPFAGWKVMWEYKWENSLNSFR